MPVFFAGTVAPGALVRAQLLQDDWLLHTQGWTLVKRALPYGGEQTLLQQQPLGSHRTASQSSYDDLTTLLGDKNG